MADATLTVFAAEQVRGVLEGAPQPDAVAARQMQALSLAVHIPLVCFGIAFPAMFLFVEGLWLRTGDPVYKALAKRWSKVALIIFATGVVTGTILSFEFGLLWPDFMATFGEVFGVAFGLEGISFFLEAIFIAIYVYGWDRLPRKTHFLTGIPIIITGATGSAFVISVNGWMNNPQGFDVVDGRVVDPVPFERAAQRPRRRTSSCTCTWRATSWPGFLVAAVLRPRAGSRARATTTRARRSSSRSRSRRSPRRSRSSSATGRRAR